MAVVQQVVDLVDILARHGLTHAVVCPGSRSAAITLSFARTNSIKTVVSIDERTAGFIALGLALELRRPVALVCTSGTAAYNFAPAVAEAFFQQIPLLVITADRPPEWVHQQDGQTIYQGGMFGGHVKKSFTFPVDTVHSDSSWFANRISNDAFLTAAAIPAGPVHINVPVREPFYPEEGERLVPGRNRLIESLAPLPALSVQNWHRLQDEWDEAEKILIAGGQGQFSPDLVRTLAQITEEWEVPVLGDVTANLGNHPDFISMQDVFLDETAEDSLVPDLLVTFGQSFLSKKFKAFLRRHPAVQHWHIGIETHLVDAFQSLTLRIPLSPGIFFSKMLEDIDYKRFVEKDEMHDDSYKQKWLTKERLAARVVNEQINENLTLLNDLTVVQKVVSELSEDVTLHFGNSMPVRYANLLRRLGLVQAVWANRGTSGIDGCVSTAIGAAMAAGKPVYLVVGDVTFLYDRNGFLIEDFPANLKVVVLNNGGGNIFRLIDGPRRQPELTRFFETGHRHTAESTAKDAGLPYFAVTDAGELSGSLSNFIKTEGPAILEVFTVPEENARLARERPERFSRAPQHP